MPAIAGQTLHPGERLCDFEIVQVIGLTSFGVLYLGRQLQDGGTVAIKEYMPSSLAARTPDGRVEVTDPAHAQAFERGLQAFLAEALTLSQFEHPNLLRVSAVWEDNGTAYRSMPYLTGTTLLAWRTGIAEPASQAQMEALLEGLLDALRTLYQAGLAHGQIEPLNIHIGEDGQPVLMDFDAVHQAVQSDPDKPYVDAYADPARAETTMSADLRSVAAVLHFAISGDWVPLRAGQALRYPPLADVLLRFRSSASALDYQPEFLAAIDSALAQPLHDGPGTITEFRALFAPDSSPIPLLGSGGTTEKQRAKRPRREPIPPAPPAYPLSSSESVLALLANFERGPATAAEDVEPFQAPEVPTLTEEAEPTLPPLRIVNPFDDLESRDSLPTPSVDEPADYEPLPYKPMPSIRPRNPWKQRLPVIAAMAAVLIATVGALAWQLVG
jgi:serine/threonine protein kinase